jgi:hypothetical protein
MIFRKRGDEADLTYVFGSVAGLLLGGLVGYLKNRLLWEKYLTQTQSSGADPGEVRGVYTRSMISYAVNIATLALVFFVRNIVPFSDTAFLIGTAAALVAMNKVLAFKQKKAV